MNSLTILKGKMKRIFDSSLHESNELCHKPQSNRDEDEVIFFQFFFQIFKVYEKK